MLVVGEPGTGKTALVQMLHVSGGFVEIDCTSPASTGLGACLFGLADISTAELELACSDLSAATTIFLRSIAELSLESQARLIRIMQDKNFIPAGSSKPAPFGGRVIASSDRDLVQMSIDGRFRRDLYYRLNSVSVRMPPLREHKEDIPLLIEDLFRRTSKDYCITRECLDAMMAYDWPGNVRELRNCAEYMWAINENHVLEASDFAVLIPEQRTSPSPVNSVERQLRTFLCHSSADKPAVRQLYGRLRSEGAVPWLDDEDLVPGQDWNSEITRAVRHSDVVLVCLSKQAVSRVGYLQKEIREALDVADQQPDGSIFLVPVRLQQCDVPERLKKWQWVNLYEENGYEKLVRALRLRASALRVTLRAVPLMFDGGERTMTLAAREREGIIEALALSHGDRAAAASLLGIGRTTLYRKLKEYGMGA